MCVCVCVQFGREDVKCILTVDHVLTHVRGTDFYFHMYAETMGANSHWGHKNLRADGYPSDK